ncbi:MAG: type II toxin-antitoxin system VapC family toxin [Deltaproteobacteria bacterium]|nr:type II toxin-antitoxin system VapC family toxin [Deltaproteobacteria bacterium]
MIWIVDASVALKWFVEEERHPHADEVLERIVERPEHFAVPELFAFEVYAVLQRVHPSAQKVFVEGILPLLQSGLLREPMTEKLARNANRFVRLGLTGYDACYAALARDLAGTWLTFDQKAHAAIEKENISCFLDKAMPRGWPD